MKTQSYIVATIKPWHIKVFHETIKHFQGKWYLITKPKELTIEKVKKILPKYIFFPHWSYTVQKGILNLSNCVCFHEADLPFGRGGSPLQNLISNGYKETYISAFKMIEQLDAGPIYLKRHLSLEGLAEEIFLRAANIIAEMIKIIIIKNPQPKEQIGKITYFNRRKPEQSLIPLNKQTLKEVFDHIRMLDADSYPKAFLEYGGFRYEITRPALKTNEIVADVRIIKI